MRARAAQLNERRVQRSSALLLSRGDKRMATNAVGPLPALIYQKRPPPLVSQKPDLNPEAAAYNVLSVSRSVAITAAIGKLKRIATQADNK